MRRAYLVFRLTTAIFILLTVIDISFAQHKPSDNQFLKGINRAKTKLVDIEVFVKAGCPHCKKAELFLQILNRENPELNIKVYDLVDDPKNFERLQIIARKHGETALRVPAFLIGDQLIVGYSDEKTTGLLIRNALDQQNPDTNYPNQQGCEAKQILSCEPEPPRSSKKTAQFQLDFLGYDLTLDNVGLPLFTLAMGLLDGFNPCSMWVLLLMISLLAPMKNRLRMFAIAGSFILVEGLAYFIFMTAWLNLFIFIGLSRISEIIIAGIAILAGTINLKDFWFFGRGISLSIPESAKPGIYARMRKVLSAQNLCAAMVGAVVLAVLVQLVELMCTSGFPALYTRILTEKRLDNLAYYGYLMLYNLAYMFDDLVILSIGIVTLSQKRLQENEGRWLKLISGLVMIGLGLYLLL